MLSGTAEIAFVYIGDDNSVSREYNVSLPVKTIKEVFGVVPLVEEGQGDGRLRVREDTDSRRIDSVLAQKAAHPLPYPVVARLTDERGWHTGTA